MRKGKSKEIVRQIAVDPHPKGNRKAVGGAVHDDWNDWLAGSTAGSLPSDQRDEVLAARATGAVYSGMIDLKPADPVEGILISQLMAANQASLSMYRRAWAQPPEYFEARLKYFALADKASRTVAMLTERLDQRRGRGQQQIVAKHVTVNADQALVTDTVVTGKPQDDPISLRTVPIDVADKPTPILDETSLRQPVGDEKKK
jgi:hypothetical protein